ncbi:hypothetical protein MASR1M90_14880 [Desulfovibrionales bacterium]
MIHSSVLSLIGASPLVRLRHIFSHPRIQLVAKLEAMNVGGSIKDRVALAMIEAAEASGELTPEKTVIEATSGNTGVGLAMVCAVKGYKMLLLMPDSASEERKRIMRAFGAELRLTPGRLGTDGAIEEAYRLAREEPEAYVLMDQYNNPASIAAHYEGTGQEIITQTNGLVTHVVACLGTTGTAMGIARRMRESAPQVQVVAVEPYAGHKIQGLKNMQESYPPGIYDKRTVHRLVRVDDEVAFACARRLAREEGILSGMSAGAALAGALQIAEELAQTDQEGLIVFICPDTGERYLSTTLFAPPTRYGLGVLNIASGQLEVLSKETGAHGLFTPGPSLDAVGDMDAWRRIVWLDVLAKALRERGQTVQCAVGLADMDDRALAAARDMGLSQSQHVAQAQSQMAMYAGRLGIDASTLFPLASTSMDQALAMTRILLGKGRAYEKLRSVYFDVTRDKSYGCVSGVHAPTQLGHTVDLSEYLKENPADFTLFKRASLQDLKLGDVLETEWGNVRPSWFLQLAAVATHTLGRVSVMLAGETHRFPHVDNFCSLWRAGAGSVPEAWMLAQPIVPHAPGAALASLDQVLAPDNGVAVRLWMLSVAYGTTLTYTDESVAMWVKNQRRLQDAYVAALGAGSGAYMDPGLEQALYELKTTFATTLEANLDLAHFWPQLFAFAKMVNGRAGRLSAAEGKAICSVFLACDRVLGFLDHERLPLPKSAWPAQVADLVAQREAARHARNFAEADAVRAQIGEMGFGLEDHPHGVRLFRRG